MKKIAVLSAGNGGQALAADLALRGHDVALYDLPQFAPAIEAIRRRGNTIELQNKITGTATIRLVTTDIAEALDGAEVVYFTAPSYGQKAFFDLAVPALSDGQVIVLMPGNYGTLALKAALREAGKDVIVAETDNLPYACAATEPGVVNVRDQEGRDAGGVPGGRLRRGGGRRGRGFLHRLAQGRKCARHQHVRGQYGRALCAHAGQRRAHRERGREV